MVFLYRGAWLILRPAHPYGQMMIRNVTLAGLLILAAAPAEPPVYRGTIDLRIGRADEARDDYIFDDVRGLAQTADGRILVADYKGNTVRVYDAKGAFVYRIGSKGKGPGDLGGPCCLSIDRTGRLWVREFSNRRVSVFSLGATRATYLWSIRGAINPWGGLEPTRWDSKGRLIDLGTSFNPADQSLKLIRQIIDSASNVVAIDTFPPPPSDSIDQYKAMQSNTKGVIGFATFMPLYGASEIRTFGPNGDQARAISSRYSVSWEDVTGHRVALIQRDLQGPSLTSKEIEKANKHLDGIAQGAHVSRSSLPLKVPERKPPIAWMGFDADGRLWIQRSVAAGQPRVADVYDRSGKWVSTMEWPNGVDLTLWAISGTTAIGIATDSNDVPTVVRLRFRK